MKKQKLFFFSMMAMLFSFGLNAQVLQPTAGTTTLTAGADFADGDLYFDSGGMGAGYTTNELGTLELCANAGETVVVDFTTFDVEASGGTGGQCWDALTVSGDTGGGDASYAGDDFDAGAGLVCTDGTDAAGDPTLGPFTSADGACLSFAFDSDGSVNNSGWEATISVNTVAPPPVGDPCTLVCPADITINLAPGACDAIANYNVELTGDCGDIELPFDAADWTTANTGGSITTNADGFTMVSGNAGSASATSSTFTATADGTLSFDWSYTTADGSAFWDPFYILVNGAEVVAIEAGTASAGTFTMALVAGDMVQILQESVDGIFGAGTSITSNTTFTVSALDAPLVLDFGLASGETFPIGTTPVGYSITVGPLALACDFNVIVVENPTTGTQINCSPANVSVDLMCEGVVDAGLLLTGNDVGCYDNYTVNLFFDMAKTQPVPGSPNVTADHIGMTLIAEVIDPASGNSCWNTVLVEDKIAPELFCVDFEVSCFEDISEELVPTNADGTATLTFPLTTGAGGQIGPDAGSILDATIDVNLPAGATIADMNVCVDVEHTFMADVRIELTSPSGTNVLIFDVTGCGGDFPIHGCFDDEAVALVDCFDLDAMGGGINLNATVPAFSDLMSEVDGEDPAGTWTITVLDQFNIDEGVLEAMSLELTLNLPAGVNEDACGLDDLSFEDTTAEGGACGNTVITRTWTATDIAGNTGTCIQTITVTPSTLADVTTPADFDGVDQPALDCEASEAKNQSTAFCGAALGWNMIGQGDFNFPVEIGHPSPADALYPCGTVKYTGTGFPGGGISCANLNYTFEDTRINICTSGSSDGCYKLIRKWTILDWCTGEILEYNQKIKVDDSEGPTLTDVEDVTVSTDVWTCTATYYVAEPWIEDNCSDLISGYTVTASAGNVSWVASLGRYVIADLPIGDYTYTVSASDCCGNETSLTHDLIVRDLVPPVAVADLYHATSLTTDGTSKVFATTFDEGSHDACGPVYLKVIRVEDLLNTDHGSFSNQSTTNSDILNGDDDIFKFGNQIYFDDHVKFECEDIGATGLQVQLRVFDVDPGNGPVDPNRMKASGDLYGHYNDSWSNIIVEDKLAPFIVPPSNITVSCSFWFDLNTLNDINNTTFGTVISTDQNGDGLVNNLDRAYIVGTDRVCPGDALYNPNNPTAQYQLDWGIDGLAGDNCSVNVTINVVDNLVCGQGNITRIFTATDPDGRTATALQSITIVDCDPFYINDNNCFNFDSQDGVRWPCDYNASTCGPETDPSATGEPQIFNDDNCALISVTYADEAFPVVPDACFKIKRIWTVTDWCQYDQFDSDVNDVYDATDDGIIAGQWEYVQFIKVLNSTAPQFTPCQDVQICGYNADCTGSASLSQTVTDDCTPEELLVIDFKIDAFNDGTYDFIGSNQAVYPYPNPNGLPILPVSYSDNGDGSYDITIGAVDYPVGTHRILWNAEDVCSNVGTCESLFTINDCKLPTPKAINGLAVENMPQSQMITLPAEWFNANSYDNCGLAQLLIGPAQGPGQMTPPATAGPTVTFTCDNLGTNNVDLWAQDINGNWDYVQTYVIVQDNQLACGGTGASSKISGSIADEAGETAEEVTVKLTGANMADQMMTGANGTYEVIAANGQNYNVAPEKLDNMREGVTTLDLVLISRHLIGLTPLDSPYKLIAADVNNDEAINTFDLLDLQRVILFIYEDFPNNESFRFVDETFSFPNNANPFETNFPEEVAINDLQQDEVANFVAIKTGDVDGSAEMNAVGTALDRSFKGDFFFNVADQDLVAGETYTVAVTANDFSDKLGYQFALGFDQNLVEFVDVTAGDLSGLTASNFGTSLLRNGVLTANYSSNEAVTVANGTVLFTVTLKAKQATKVSQALNINRTDYIRAEAYNANLDHLNVNLQFTSEEGVSVATTDFALLQNQPNPFQDVTEIGFVLPEAAQATITIYDVSGKTLRVIEGDYAKGYNKVEVTRDALGAAGVLYYQLDTDNFSATKKMVVIK